MNLTRRILVAPLNWGLGHATRCIPIIDALLEEGFEPILASDGVALELLKKEYPTLKHVELPSYHIEYAKNGKNFKLKMLWDSPKMLKAINKEKKFIQNYIAEQQIDGIISDNRLGVISKEIPSVFITHQLNVLTGNTTWLSSKIHQKIIKKYNECWVPDVELKPNLSGKLGHLKKNKGITVKYIGPISRIKKLDLPKVYDVCVLLSGPEPQRTFLESILLQEFAEYNGKILFVKGKIEAEQECIETGNMTIYNYMNKEQLEIALNESDVVVSRSGYTTILDLAKLSKKAFFIPTPGQYEQEYLAKRLNKKGIVPSCKQNKFDLEKMEKVRLYRGLKVLSFEEPSFSNLFSLFKSEREL